MSNSAVPQLQPWSTTPAATQTLYLTLTLLILLSIASFLHDIDTLYLRPRQTADNAVFYHLLLFLLWNVLFGVLWATGHMNTFKAYEIVFGVGLDVLVAYGQWGSLWSRWRLWREERKLAEMKREMVLKKCDECGHWK
jgi:hypothetical protein